MDETAALLDVSALLTPPANNPALAPLDPLNTPLPIPQACESGEHMPDKARYVEQMTRALAPGGTLVIATWCQREAGVGGAPPLNADEQAKLQFLYDEWAHPYFVSVEEYGRMLQVRESDG